MTMRATAASLALLVTGCSRGDAPAATADSGPHPPIIALAPGDSTNCPSTGVWIECAAIKRLDGLTKKLRDSVEHDEYCP